jgi:hypothetical protein
MSRESLIRRLPEIAFALLFCGGLMLGGDAALAGLPRLVDAMTPDMAAQANVKTGASRNVARFAIPDGFAQSRFAPQLLYPVTTRPKPDWLVEAMRTSSPVPAARGRPVIAICIDDLGEDLAGTG